MSKHVCGLSGYNQMIDGPCWACTEQKFGPKILTAKNYDLEMPSAILPPNPKQAYGDRKVAVQHVPPTAEIYLGLAMQDGARKYGPFNWRLTKVEAMTYVGACRRHLSAWVDGEERAEDSGYPHLAHAMACLAILADAFENDALIDNRPAPGSTARLLKEWERK